MGAAVLLSRSCEHVGGGAGPVLIAGPAGLAGWVGLHVACLGGLLKWLGRWSCAGLAWVGCWLGGSGERYGGCPQFASEPQTMTNYGKLGRSLVPLLAVLVGPLCAAFPANPPVSQPRALLHCSWHVFGFFSFLVLFIFTGGLQKTKFFATIPRVEMTCHDKCRGYSIEEILFKRPVEELSVLLPQNKRKFASAPRSQNFSGPTPPHPCLPSQDPVRRALKFSGLVVAQLHGGHFCRPCSQLQWHKASRPAGARAAAEARRDEFQDHVATSHLLLVGVFSVCFAFFWAHRRP